MTKLTNIFFRIKNKFFVLFVLSAIFLSSYYSYGYVMPAEQILDYMIKNFSGYNTVTLIQSTLQTVDGNEKVFTEQIWLESPDKYSTKALDRVAERDVIAPDILYRQLFIANPREKIERILLSLGIDLTKTSYTRFEGAIAYQIGRKDPDSPILIIEKERFLPLLIKYRVPDRVDSKLITVKFEEYQEEDKGWYPSEITYEEGENLIEKYTMQNLQVNIPIDASILNQFPEYEVPELPESVDADSKGASNKPGIDKDRLKNVIKAFEDQYQ